jgi:murein DD-endopeptidase MepM/ murein hydrolase activator NlpD
VARPFPSGTRGRRRAAVVAAACAVVLASLTAPLAIADDLKDKQKEVKKDIKAAKGELHEASKAMARATEQLRQAQAELSAAQARLAETRGQLVAAQVRDRKMQAKLEQAIKDLERARGELIRGREEVAEQRVAVGEMVAANYEHGDPRLLGLASVLQAEDLGDMTRAMATNESLVTQENHALDRLRAVEVLLAVQEAKVEKQKGVVEVQRQEAAENLKLMEALEAQAEAEEASVRSLVGARSAALRSARKARAEDQKVIVALRAEESQISEMLRQRAIAAARAAAKSQSSGAKNAGGYLSYPVNGYVTSPYGYRRHPIYGYYGLHNGTDFGAGCGEPLYASAKGTVVDGGYSGSYGNYLIVDHGYQAGVGLASRYNHATHYTVSPGERVGRGEVVGYVGSTGWSTGCHLHFSVLANGRYVDPMNWL